MKHKIIGWALLSILSIGIFVCIAKVIQIRGLLFVLKLAGFFGTTLLVLIIMSLAVDLIKK